MSSTLTVTNLTATNLTDGGGTTSTFANVVDGSIKAYSEQDNTGVTVSQSLNQSSITDSSTGHKIHTWTTAFSTNTYLGLVGVCGNRNSTTGTVRGVMPDAAWTTTAADVRYAFAPSTAEDVTQTGMAVVGDLA
mgnify:FL=1|tara:strand:+ start:683 stop:1084 length:402 start_codon:yes stop_codon:yes gene_type:complete